MNLVQSFQSSLFWFISLLSTQSTIPLHPPPLVCLTSPSYLIDFRRSTLPFPFFLPLPHLTSSHTFPSHSFPPPLLSPLLSSIFLPSFPQPHPSSPTQLSLFCSLSLSSLPIPIRPPPMHSLCSPPLPSPHPNSPSLPYSSASFLPSSPSRFPPSPTYSVNREGQQPNSLSP